MAHELQAEHRDRYAWMEGVLADDGLPAGAKNVATRLALHKNVKSGRCDPAIDTIADGTAMTRRGVQKAIADLERAGWIKRSTGGHGRRDTNSYELVSVTGTVTGQSRGHRVTPRDIPERANQDAAQGERKSERNDTNERTTVRTNTVNLQNTEINIGADPDADAESSASASKNIIELKSIALRLADIAGISRNAVWPLHWQNATEVINHWRQRGYTTDAILQGARLTMQNKKSLGPPASVEYFEQEIGRIMRLQQSEIPPAEAQRACREIVAKLGEPMEGWRVLQALSPTDHDELVSRWLKGTVTEEELHALKFRGPSADRQAG